jgi:predicted enzyme related to lactoylglutathione lyase
MLKNSPFFAGIAIDDVDAAKKFYGETLGVFEVTQLDEHLLTLRAGNGYAVLLYAKPGHVPAEHTVLNFPVDDIDRTVEELTARGVAFQRYPGTYQDDKGIQRGRGPAIAWFTDPAGNILSVLQP